MKRLLVILAAIPIFFIIISICSAKEGKLYTSALEITHNSTDKSDKPVSLPLDTIIEAPLFKIDNSFLKQLFDSSLAIDPYKNLVLTHSSNKLYPEYLELERKPINLSNIGSINGIYIDSISGKPVIIMGLSDEDLKNYNITDSTIKSKLNIKSAPSTNIKVNHLGITNYIRFESDSTISVLLGYNGQTIFKYPEIANKFSFIGDSIVYNEILKNKESDRILKRVIKRIKEHAPRNHAYSLNDTGDSITQIFSFGSAVIASDTDKFITLPVYKFDNSVYGSLTKRICDSLAMNDIYTRHYIRSKNTDGDEVGITIYGVSELQDRDIFNAQGIIWNSDGEHPFLLYDVTPELLKKFGITSSKKKIVALFKIFRYIPMADDSPPGYYITLDEGNDGILNLGIGYANRRPFEEEARPFKWIIEDYINVK